MTRGNHAAFICLLSAVIALLPGRAQRATTPKTLSLPSGEQIELIDAHEDEFTDVSGHKRHIYYVGYETSHGMDQTALLRTEARRTFAMYLPQLVGLDYDTCVVTPMQRTASGDQEGRPYYFTREPDGRWSLQP